MSEGGQQEILRDRAIELLEGAITALRNGDATVPVNGGVSYERHVTEIAAPSGKHMLKFPSGRVTLKVEMYFLSEAKRIHEALTEELGESESP